MIMFNNQCLLFNVYLWVWCIVFVYICGHGLPFSWLIFYIIPFIISQFIINHEIKWVNSIIFFTESLIYYLYNVVSKESEDAIWGYFIKAD